MATRRAAAKAGANEKLLLQVATAAENDDPDLSVSAAETAVSIKSEAQSNFVLGKALKQKAITAFVLSGKPHPEFLERSKTALELTLRQARTPSPEMYFELGDVLQDLDFEADAESNFLKALKACKQSYSQDACTGSIRGMVRVTYTQKRSAESQAWFKTLADQNLATAGDWNAEAQRRFNVDQFAESGDAYTMSLGVGGDWTNSCDAAFSYWRALNKQDAVLSSARECITAGTGKRGSEERISGAHYVLADTLNGRGVFSEALTHAREAVDLNSTSPWAFDAEADALIGLRRFQEAVTAAAQAIRLSDGKYSSMHFTLGKAYFGQENWEFARQSFEKASELEPTDTAAPYNVAVCFANLGYRSDAAKWYAEVLRRNPNYPDREQIRRQISILTAGLQ